MAETACESDPVPMKPTHARWCALVASGEDRHVAYRLACTKDGEKMTEDAAWKGAQRLSRNVLCQREIARLRRESEKMAGGVLMTLAERREKLARIARVPFGPITKASPYAYDLMQLNGIEEPEDGDMLPGMQKQLKMLVIERVAMADVMRAIELDSKLAGDFSEDKLNLSLSDGLEGVLARL